MIKLYIGNLNYSSWSIRAVLVARAAGLDIEEVVLPLGPQETVDTLMQATGQHRVPALVTDTVIIHDSMAITEWVAEQVEPGKVWPINPDKRALARSICAEMHASFIDLRSDMGVDIKNRHATPEMTPGLKWDIDRVLQIWEMCRSTYKADGPYLFGEWSAADAVFMPVATRFQTYGIDLNPAAQTYSDAVLSHPLSKELIDQAHAETWTIDLTRFRPKSAD
ncbi:MAG: glutathione S-transferase family protein [Henriciella sp.]